MKQFFLFTLLIFTGYFDLGMPHDGALQHVVLIWLQDAGNAEHRQKIIEASRSFRDIPGVLDVKAGKAVMSDRDIVDDSFDVGFLVMVPDERRLAEYIVHPIHQRVRNDVVVPLVEKILVYDFKR